MLGTVEGEGSERAGRTSSPNGLFLAFTHDGWMIVRMVLRLETILGGGARGKEGESDNNGTMQGKRKDQDCSATFQNAFSTTHRFSSIGF